MVEYALIVGAIALVLLMVIMIFTAMQFYFAKYWVFYEGEARG